MTNDLKNIMETLIYIVKDTIEGLNIINNCSTNYYYSKRNSCNNISSCFNILICCNNTIYSKYNYSFQSNVKKCLILTCIPTQCYFKDSSGYMRKIDTGEKIGEYTIYSSQGFLGALDRNCLDR